MHPCLAIPDVQSLIFDHFPTITQHRKADLNSMHTLAILARTSQAFTEHALDVLWCNQATLGPLIQVMPSDIWKVHESKTSGSHTVTFTHTPEDKHWERFKYYAQMVRTVGFYRHKHSLKIHEDVMMMLASYRPVLSLLPVLREIAFRMNNTPDKKSLLFAQCLLSSTIQHVSLVINAEQYASCSLIAAIRHNCPDLRILKIKLFSPPPSTLVSALTNLVLALPHLQRLSIPTLPLRLDTLLHISSLLSLQILETGNLFLDEPQQLRLFSESNGHFPCLHDLTFSVDSLEAAIVVLDTIRHPLTSLAITIRMNVPSAQLNSIIRTVTQYPWHTTLLHLRISIGPSRNVPGELDDAPDIRSLFLLPAIQSLALRSRLFAAAIDDGWLATAAVTWPHLRSLSIREKTRTTLAGLVPLVRSCPLDHICIDANWAPFDIRRMDPIVGNTQIETITMCNSDLEGDALAVLRCLLTMFPRLKAARNLADDENSTWAELQNFLDRSLQY